MKKIKAEEYKKTHVNLLHLSYIFSLIILLSCTDKKYSIDQSEISIPVAGNSWIINQDDETKDNISEEGIKNWSDPGSRIRIYFYIEQKGEIYIGIRARVNFGQSKIKFTFADESKEITLSNAKFENIPIGIFNIDNPGYQWLEMQGIEKSGEAFAEVTDVIIDTKCSEENIFYVKDDFYWGRRGPSVHLNYLKPEECEALWCYNEVTIPRNNDVLGSFFMANGFAEGYFGIQVNSASERRILFSVWSPFQTDNPAEIPDEYKIQLLKKGKKVHTGKFGNEGSGGQSYRIYNWKSETTYRFLLKGQPSPANSTDFTAYFFAPEIGKWELIASFRRPKTKTYLKHLHSFSENFLTETGYISRKGIFSNQWICNTESNWHELAKAKFTADATARKEARLDYSGGSENGVFFLKNCGFFNEKLQIGTILERDRSGKAPVIDFSKLPVE